MAEIWSFLLEVRVINHSANCGHPGIWRPSFCIFPFLKINWKSRFLCAIFWFLMKLKLEFLMKLMLENNLFFKHQEKQRPLSDTDTQLCLPATSLWSTLQTSQSISNFYQCYKCVHNYSTYTNVPSIYGSNIIKC